MPSGSIRVGGSRVDFTANTTQYDAALARVQATNFKTAGSYAGLGAQTARANNLTNQFTSSIRSSLIATVAYAAGVEAVRRAVTGTVGGFIEWEQGLIAVQKTTNLTDAQTERLERNLDRLLTTSSSLGTALPVVSEDLLEIAEVAGQMNIRGVRDITNFTEAVSLLTLTTELGGADAANALGILLANTTASVDDSQRLGAVLTALGNQFRGGEVGILAIAEDIARSTSEFQLSADSILAFSAVFAQSGARAEKTGTVFQRAIRALITAADEATQGSPEKLSAIADAANVSFETLLDTIERRDFTGALTVLGEALNNLEDIGGSGQLSRGSLLTLLFGGETPPVRIAEVLGVMAENMGEVTRALRISEAEWEQQIATLIEAGKFNEAYRASLIRVGNEIEGQARDVGRVLTPAFVLAAENFRLFELAVVAAGTAFVSRFGARRVAAFRESSRAISAATTAEVATIGRAAQADAARSVIQSKVTAEMARRVMILNTHRAAQEAALVTEQRYLATLRANGVITGFTLRESERLRRSIAKRQVAITATNKVQRDSNLTGFALLAQQERQIRAAQAAAKGAATHAAAQAALNARIAIGTRVARLWTGTIAFLGGPVSAAITAITALTTAFFLFRERAEDLVDPTQEARESIQGLIDDLNRDASPLTQQGAVLSDVEEQIRVLREEREALERERERLATSTLDPRSRLARRRNIDRRIAPLTSDIEDLTANLEIANNLMEELGAEEAGVARLQQRFRDLDTSLESPVRRVRDFARATRRAAEEAVADAGLQLRLVGLSERQREIETRIFEEQRHIRSEHLRVEQELRDAISDQQRAQAIVREAEAQVNNFEIGSKLHEQAIELLKNAVRQAEAKDREVEALREQERATRDIAGNQRLITEAVDKERAARAAAFREQLRSLEVEPPDFDRAEDSVREFLDGLERGVKQGFLAADQARQVARVPEDQQAALEAQFEVINAFLERQTQTERNLEQAHLDLTRATEDLAAAEAALAAAGDDATEAQRSAVLAAREEVTVRQNQVAVLRRTGQELDANREKVEGLARAAGEARQEMEDLGKEAANGFSLVGVAGDLAASGVNSIENALVNLREEGARSFKALADAIIDDLIRILVRAVIVNNIIRGIAAAFPSLAPALGVDLPTAHEGGISGHLPLRPFKGVGPDEEIALLRRDEEVLTARDPRHRNNIFAHSMRDLESWVARLPRYHQGGISGPGGGRSIGGRNLEVRVINESSQPVRAVSGDVTFDADRAIATVILRDVRRNGPISQALQHMAR